MSEEKNHVVDFTKAREEKLDDKRRKAERIFFKQILGVYTVIGDSDMRPIEIVDVSEDGLSFQVPFDENNPWPTETADVPIRLYFSQETYLPIRLSVQNSRPCIEEGIRYTRFGCTVDQSMTAYEAYRQFVQFLKSYSEHAHKHDGNMTLFYL